MKRSGRRGNGEGSIYQLPNGRWRGSVFLGYRDGKPHRKYVTRRTRAEVAVEIRRLLEAHRRGQLVTTGSMTVGEWFATYLDQVARPTLRPRTFDLYSVDISRHILPAIGRHRLDKLRPAHLVELYNAKAAEGLSGSSVRHIHAVIRRALNVAVRWQLIAVNPATLVDAPKAEQHEVIPLSAAQARRLIRVAEDDRMAARWLVGPRSRAAAGRGAWPVVGGRRCSGPGPACPPSLAAPTRRRPGVHRAEDCPVKGGRSRSRSSSCAPWRTTRSGRTRSALPRARCGGVVLAYSPRQSVRRSIRGTTTASSRSCSARRPCLRSGCMICGTRRPVFWSLRVCRPGWSWRSSVTARSRSDEHLQPRGAGGFPRDSRPDRRDTLAGR